MASNLHIKQVSNVERRTWDLEFYEKKAQQRQKAIDEAERSSSNHGKARPPGDTATAVTSLDDDKEEFRPAMFGSLGPEGSDRAYLKARRGKVTDIDSKVGKIEMVSADAAATTKSKLDEQDPSVKQGVVKTGVGWHCKVCDCFLKDSHTYLDHINGRKHQRKLGYSMRVERSTKEDLVAKLKSLTESKEESKNDKQYSGEVDFSEIVKAKDEELEKRREERRKRRKERKAQQRNAARNPPEKYESNEEEDKGVTDPAGQEEGAARDQKGGPEIDENKDGSDDDLVEPEIDPNLAAVMGFAGFGG